MYGHDQSDHAKQTNNTHSNLLAIVHLLSEATSEKKNRYCSEVILFERVGACSWQLDRENNNDHY